MKSVYIVTAGTYSDYRIEAVFDDVELAKAFVMAFTHPNEMDIEEWNVNPNMKDLKRKRKSFTVQIGKNGAITHLTQNSSVPYESHRIVFTNDKELMTLHCYADDEPHAIKIANEKRTQILALNRWGVKDPL